MEIEPADTLPPMSVHDTAFVPYDGTPESALEDTVLVARAAEQYGYRRLWVPEFHNVPMFAASAPPVLMAHLAAATRHIRIGSGGILLTNHAPLVVAEQFAVLRALHGDRIDLGLGRAPGADSGSLFDQALQRPEGIRSRFPELLDELLGFLHREWPPEHPYRALELSPRITGAPSVHVLGASADSAAWAAERGLPFVFGCHLAGAPKGPAAAARYAERFVPGRDGGRPHFTVSVEVLCGESDEEASALVLRTAEEFVRVHNRAVLDQLSAARITELARQTIEAKTLVHGGPETVAARLAALARTLRADEIMVMPYGVTGAGRSRTLRLLARHQRQRSAAAGAYADAVTVRAGG